MKTVRMAILVALALFLFIGERIPHPTRTADPIFYYVLTGIGIAMIVSMFFIRRATIIKSEGSLAESESDPRSLYFWRIGYIVTFAISEAVALLVF
jgi:hypothetical protein